MLIYNFVSVQLMKNSKIILLGHLKASRLNNILPSKYLIEALTRHSLQIKLIISGN